MIPAILSSSASLDWTPRQAKKAALPHGLRNEKGRYGHGEEVGAELAKEGREVAVDPGRDRGGRHRALMTRTADFAYVKAGLRTIHVGSYYCLLRISS